jgi:hypothetical protein
MGVQDGYWEDSKVVMRQLLLGQKRDLGIGVIKLLDKRTTHSVRSKHIWMWGEGLVDCNFCELCCESGRVKVHLMKMGILMCFEGGIQEWQEGCVFLPLSKVLSAQELVH